ncbi:MAG: hypothetical protein HQ538_01385 [Parcubacteria group bacterium]|nr:hypothetical protein [Parcubacteria group bacterium]
MTEETAIKEQQVQREVIDYLRLTGWYVYKNSSVGIFNKKTGSYIPAQTKGIADLTAIKNSKVIQVEVKRKGGKQSRHQAIFEQDWTEKGGTYIIGGLDEVISLINK